MRHLLILLFMLGLVGVSVRVAISAIRSCRTWRRAGLVGDTPTCTRCQYEITGIQAAKPCPECGADLTEVDSVTIGYRRPKPSQLVFGLALIAGCLYLWSFSIPLLPGLTRRAMWAIEPSSWLVESFCRSRLRSGVLGSVWELRSELARRIREDRMSEKAWKRLASGLFENPSPVSQSDELAQAIGDTLLQSATRRGRATAFWEGILIAAEGKPSGIPFELETPLGTLLQTNELDSESRRRLVSALIRRQASSPTDPNRWKNRMQYPLSHGLERAIGRGLIPLPEVQKYFEATVRPQIVMEHPESLKTDRTVQFQMRFGLPRDVIGTRVACSMKIVGEASGWPMSGGDIEPAVMRHEELEGWDDQQFGDWPRWWMTLPSKPGVYVLEAELDLRVYELEERGSAGALATGYADPARLGARDSMKVHVVKRCSLEVRVTQADVSTPITMTDVNDPKTVLSNSGRWAGIFGWKSTSADLVDIRFDENLAPPPVTIAADVFVRQGDTVKKVGWILVPAGGKWHERVSAAWTGVKAGACVVILQPNPGILRDSTGFGPLYGRSLSEEILTWNPPPSEWDGNYYNWPD